MKRKYKAFYAAYSFNGGHPIHVSSLVDMQLIHPKRFWYLYGSGSFTMSIIVVPRKGWYKLRLTMESNIHMRNIIHTYSFNGGHPTHVSSLVDMQLIPPKRFWYLYGLGSFTMSIIVVSRKWWLTRRNREVVDFTRFRVKNISELTNLRI